MSTPLLVGAAAVILVLIVVVALVVRGRRSDSSAAAPEAEEAGPKPAGWYVDPADESQVRWWNGSAWTDHVQDKPEVT